MPKGPNKRDDDSKRIAKPIDQYRAFQTGMNLKKKGSTPKRRGASPRNPGGRKG